MKSVYNFVVTPIGERYNNTKKIGDSELILNTEIFNHQYVNRLAKVISTPIIGDTDIKPEDEVITHFNVFRRWNDVKGVERNSRSYFDESTYFITQDLLFLYKRNGHRQNISHIYFRLTIPYPLLLLSMTKYPTNQLYL